jgi:hypothetical protein
MTLQRTVYLFTEVEWYWSDSIDRKDVPQHAITPWPHIVTHTANGDRIFPALVTVQDGLKMMQIRHGAQFTALDPVSGLLALLF